MDLKCPACGGEIEQNDCLDIEFYLGKARRFCIGQCVECGEQVQWDEIYQFSHYKNIVTM